jgi:hypothetical protein
MKKLLFFYEKILNSLTSCTSQPYVHGARCIKKVGLGNSKKNLHFIILDAPPYPNSKLVNLILMGPM